MSVRYNYNRQVAPPAPFVHVRLARPDDLTIAADLVPAQLDSAADVTVIPQRIIDKLQLVRLDHMAVGGFGGYVKTAATYFVNLAIREFPAIDLRVIADEDEPYVLLGLDVLNRYRLILDGPNLVLEIDS